MKRSISYAVRLGTIFSALLTSTAITAQITNSPAGDTPFSWGGIAIYEDDGESRREFPKHIKIGPNGFTEMNEEEYLKQKGIDLQRESDAWRAQQDRLKEQRLQRNVKGQTEGLFSLISEPDRVGAGSEGQAGSQSGSADSDNTEAILDLVRRMGEISPAMQAAFSRMLEKSHAMIRQNAQYQHDRIAKDQTERRLIGDGPGLESGETGLNSLLESALANMFKLEISDSVVSSNGFRSAQILPIYRGYELDKYGTTWRSLNLFANGPSSIGNSLNTTIVGMPSAVGRSLDLHPAGPSSVGQSLNLYPAGPSSVGQSLDLYPALCGR